MELRFYLTALISTRRLAKRTGLNSSLHNPQIINGGQTAFTLSRLYEQFVVEGSDKQIFDSKEVLLKVITFHPQDQASQDEYLKLIQSISRATNQQSQVNELQSLLVSTIRLTHTNPINLRRDLSRAPASSLTLK